MGEGPLAGLRVVDLTDDTGRFATKLLAEGGAHVVRVGHATSGPAMVDERLAARGGLLDWWYDAGKDRVDVDLDTPAGQDAYRRLATGADLVIETEAPGRLAGLGLDHDDLVTDNPTLVQVALTPFGRTGPRSGWQTSDLVAGALGGVLSVSGTAERAVGSWGRQNFHVGSMMAAVCGLAGVHAARRSGRGQLVDLSLHETVASSLEQMFFQHWFDDLLEPFLGLPKVALRQGSRHWTGLYEVVSARTGACMVTPTPHAGPLYEWMAEEGDAEGAGLAALAPDEAIAAIPRAMAAIKAFARTKDAGELFHEAQRRHVAFGEVQTVAQMAENPQYDFRDSYRPVDGFDRIRLVGPYARFHSTHVPPARPPSLVMPVDELPGGATGTAARIAPSAPARGHPDDAAKPLAGLRVVDFTWVLAGPFCCRILGDLGADVLKFQTAERATTVNSPDFPYFYAWNRSKRSASIDMKHEQATVVMRRIIEQCDVVIENFSAGVLERWGLGYEEVREWNPNIIYLTMSGCGHSGPWSRMITYAPTIHALCGLTHLSNTPGRQDIGPGFSLNDHAAGLSAAVAVLSALEARRRTGEGQHVDIAQIETGTYLIGAALTDYFANGREAQPIGNADPFGHWCPNEVYRAGDQHEVAITCRTDAEWVALCAVVGPWIAHLAADPGCATAAGRFDRAAEIDRALAEWVQSRRASSAADALQAAGVPAGMVQNGDALTADPQLAARGFFGAFDHALFGTRPFDRFPARWSDSDLEPYLPSPAYVGEHNFEIFTELAGMSEEEIALGMADGLFG